MDECGFAPTLPVSYSWALPGERKYVPHEYPQGRRVNAVAAYRPYDRLPWLGVMAAERTLTSADLLAFLQDLPWAPVPRVVVLDNAGLHTSAAVKAARTGLAKRGVYLYYLPAYSPELNDIEAVLRQIKHHEIPTRSYTAKADLRAAVERGFKGYARKLLRKPRNKIRPAA